MPKILKKSGDTTPLPATTPTAAAKVAAARPGGKKKPATPPATPAGAEVSAPTVPPRPAREVIYPKVEAEICTGDNAITEEVARIVLGWETEQQHQKRMVEESPGTKPEHWTFGEAFMLRDEDGNKVQCFHNLDNRPFDETWSRGLAQTILRGQWAGEITVPGETINGSTVCLSRTGRVESGQHSLAAVVLAHQMWTKNPTAYPFWMDHPAGPVIETIIIKGISEDPRVTMTVDNCKPRSMADVFYTSELFRNLIAVDRRECSKMMANAVDHLWTRVAAQGYRTPPEQVGFADRHPHLLKCVEHLFGENKRGAGNKTRPISNLRITPGLAASLCYLMGASGPATDGDVYRNGFPPGEKDIDWTLWPKAKEFWALVGAHESFKWVRVALATLMESEVNNENNVGLGGRLPERLAIVQKAWDVFVNHDPSTGAAMFNKTDLREGGALALSYNNLDDEGNALPDGQLKLIDRADFGGVDLPGESATTAAITNGPPPKTTAEILAERDQVDRERAAAELAKQQQQQASRPPSARAVEAAAKLKAMRKS